MRQLYYHLLSIITVKAFFGGNNETTSTYAFGTSKSRLSLKTTGTGRYTRLYSSSDNSGIIQDNLSDAKCRNEGGDIRKEPGKGNGSDQKSADSGNIVQVRVQRDLPNLSSPMEAKDAWLSYVWTQGGGLPVWVIPKNDDDEDNNVNPDASGRREIASMDQLDQFLSSPSRRLLLPLGMEEKLILSNDDENEDELERAVLKYKVSDAGLLSAEIKPYSHLGTLTFAPLSSSSKDIKGVSMTWDVTFKVQQSSRRGFWQLVTEQMITDASNNLVSYLDTPIIYTRRTRLITGSSSNQNISSANLDPNYSDSTTNSDSPSMTIMTPQLAMEKWIDFLWRDGAGMPFPPPLNYIENNEEGEEFMVRWIIPPFLKERIIQQTVFNSDHEEKRSKEKKDPFQGQTYCEILYTVDNPSIMTYQVHSHLGRVRFIQDDSNKMNENDKASLNSSSNIDMIWEIEICPYHNWSTFLKLFTSTIVSNYAKNFKCHLNEGPDAMVSLKLFSEEKAFMKIRKDSWIGGVLDAHLNDTRSTLEQTKSIFQPWTWGRKDGDGDEEVWSEGHLS